MIRCVKNLNTDYLVVFTYIDYNIIGQLPIERRMMRAIHLNIH